MEVKYWMSNLSHTIHGMVCLPTLNCFLYGKWVSIYTIPMDLMGIVKKHVQHPQVVWVRQGKLFVIYLVRPKNNFPCKTRFTMIDKKSLVTRNFYFPSCELLFLPCKKKLRNQKTMCFWTTTTEQLPTQQGALVCALEGFVFLPPGPFGWWRVQTVGSCCRHTTITPGVARGMGVEWFVSWVSPFHGRALL